MSVREACGGGEGRCGGCGEVSESVGRCEVVRKCGEIEVSGEGERC